MIRKWLAMLGYAVLTAAAEAGRLPVFFSDNHAESFGWITRNVDLDEPLWLLLVDAHTDASAVERSEEIREQLRRVPSLAARAERVAAWRADGRMQAYNWIEPCMPRPIERVLWVAALEMSAAEAEQRTAEAVAALDGRLEVEPRGAGSFAGRWQSLSAREWESWPPVGGRRLLLSIDLDFFTGMEPSRQESELGRIWRRAMDWPGLVGVSFALSRPWLKDDAEADFLAQLAMGLVARTRGAVLELDARRDDRPDASLRAGEWVGEPPRWEAAAASPALVAQWVNLGRNLRMHSQDLLPEEWPAALRVVADSGEMGCDGVWRFDIGEAPTLRIRGAHDATGRVRWHALRPARTAYDFLPETRLGKDFSESPGRWIYEERHEIGETRDLALAADLWKPEGPGQVRIEAQVETSRGWLPTLPVEIRLTQGGGFRGALSEVMRMPYGFGIAMLGDDDWEAVETGWAADCSNALIHAWRKCGVPMRWGDPGVLRSQLETLAEGVRVNSGARLSAEQIERGVVLDIGSHVAALWHDHEPKGVLDGSDRVFHHLGGQPEIVSLAEWAAGRPVFALRGLPEAARTITLKLAGDVVLAEEDFQVAAGMEKGNADWFVANLEGIPSMREPEGKLPRVDFRFPAERLDGLRERGLDALSLANNHAGDAGSAGLLEGMAAIRAAGLASFGAGKDQEEACQPWIARRGNDSDLAFFGVCLVDGMIAGPQSPGIAHLPTHAARLEHAMREAREAGAKIIVLMHGGDEYRVEINDDQRRWARWLVRRGARVVAGAHPHVVQRAEQHGGAHIWHSLGNAIYPTRLAGMDCGVVVEISMPP